MTDHNLYSASYIKSIYNKITLTKVTIFVVIFVMIAFALVSILLSDNASYQGLLYANIPLDIFGMIVIFIASQVYMPTYRWEFDFSQRIDMMKKENVSGQVIEINHQFGYYENQRMISILVKTAEKNQQIYMRPWLFESLIQKNKVYMFEVVSRVVIGYKVGAQS